MFVCVQMLLVINSFFPIQDEFHSRLRFNRRGLVAMANAGPHDNGSQFFFTLGRADELNNKHTIFGKVTFVKYNKNYDTLKAFLGFLFYFFMAPENIP